MIELMLVTFAIGAVVLGAGMIVLPIGFGLASVVLVIATLFWTVSLVLRVVGWVVGTIFVLVLSIIAVPLMLVIGLALGFGVLLAMTPVLLPLAAVGIVIWLCVRHRVPSPNLPAT